MKKNLLLLFILLPLIGFSQNIQTVREQAGAYYRKGDFKKSLEVLNTIKDKSALENTNINLYKAHLENIINYRFFKKKTLNDSLSKVYITTNVLKSQGIFNTKSNKYTVPPIYDSIENKEYYIKFLNAFKDNLTSLVNIETGKVVIAPGEYKSQYFQDYLVTYTKVRHNSFFYDDVINVFDLKGNLLYKDLEAFEIVDFGYTRIKYKNGTSKLIAPKTKKIVLEDFDYLERPVTGTIENGVLYDNNWLPFYKHNKKYLYKITATGIEDTHKFDFLISNRTFSYFTDNAISTIINKKDNAISCPEISDRICFYNDYSIVKKDNKYGIFNISKDNYYKEPVYDSITDLGNTFYNGKWINLVYNEEICFPTTVSFFAYTFKRNNKFGLLDFKGNIVADAEYDEVVPGYNDIYFLRKEKKWGFIGLNKNDKLVVPKYDFIAGYRGNIRAYKNKSVTEFLPSGIKAKPADLKDKVPSKNYIEQNSSNFIDGKEIQNSDRLVFEKNKKYGLDDLNNNEIVSAKYTYIKYNKGNTFLVYKDSLEGMIDHNGKELIPVKYQDIEYRNYSSNLLFVKNDRGLYGIFNLEGEMLYPFKIKDVITVQSDVANNEYVCASELYTNGNSKTNEEKFVQNVVLKIGDKKVEKLNIDGPSYSFLDNKFLAFGGNGWQTGFYNLNNGKILDHQFTSYFYDNYTPNKRIIAKKGEYYDTIIDSLSNVSNIEHPFFEIINGYYFYKEENKIGVMDKSFKTAGFTYPVLQIMMDTEHSYASLEYKQKARNYFLFNTKTDSKKNGLITFDGTIIFQPEKYDDVALFYFEKNQNGYDYYPEIGHSTKLPNQYLKKYDAVFLGVNKLKDAKIINLSTVENGSIAEFKVKKDENWKFCRYNNAVIIKSKDSVRLYNLNSKKIDFKINANGVIEDSDHGFTVSNFDVKTQKKRFTKYDRNGKFIFDTIVEKEKEYRGSYNENYIKIKNKKYGTVTSTGKPGIPFVYDHLETKNSKIFIAKNNTVYGLIDGENQTVLDKKYQDIKWREINAVYSKNSAFSAILLKEKNKWGLIDLNLKTILPTEFDTIQVKEKFITAKKDSLISYYELNGNLNFTAAVDSINYVQYDSYALFKKGKKVFINKKGKLVDQNPYMSWEDETKAKYCHQIDSKYYLSKNDTIIYKTPINSIVTVEGRERILFTDLDYLLIKNENNRYAMYTTDLREIFPFEYNDIILVKNESFFIVNKNDKYGVVNLKNEVLIPFEYDKIEYDYRRFFKCTKEKRDYNITPQNKIIYNLK